MFKANYWKKVLLIVAVVGMSWAGVIEAQEVTTLVAKGSTWEYDDTNRDRYSDIPSWPSADDSGWASGPAPLGFGTLNQGEISFNTTLTINSPRHTCYFRHTFNVADPSIYESLTLRILRDDGCVVYLNGTEVVRSNMPGGGISHSTWSSEVVGGSNETAYFEYAVDPAVLVVGDNVFAVDVHQCNGTSSDLGLDLELEAVGVDPQSPYQPTLVGPADGAASVSTSPTLEVTVSDPDGSTTLTVDFWGRPLTSTGDPFTIIALPDTQKYVNSTGNPDIFTSQTQWIVDNKGSENIVFVTHEGDITDSTDREGNAAVVEAEWIKASYSMSLLDGAVSYGVCPGNHDKPGTVPDFYNIYFPYTRFGFDHYPGSDNDNNFELFSAGGMDFIIVHLQVYPDQGVFDWANGVLDYYSDRIAILTMHQYLNTNGSRMDVGQDVWDRVIAPNNNVNFVFCGHNHGEAYRMDVEGGREVHQLLADYQSYSNGGNGYLRIMRFVPSEDAVYVKTYSPWVDQFESDGNSEFTIDFPMGEPFTAIGSDAGVASGANASVEWSGLSIGTDYEWFVEVTDTTFRTTVGPVWSFTTALAPEASNPNPPDGATGVDIDADLSWSPGINAVKHDVYFGTNPDSLPLVSEDQTGTTYDPGTIPNDTLFFWRIDECDENGDVIAAGYVWSFTTAPVPGPASYPSPADGATEVSTTAQLSWTAGSDTTSHKVYFGTVDPPPFVQNQSGTTFDPGLLDNDVTYYWQIDEIGPGGITLGAVWSFTAEPVPPLLPWSDDFESVGFSVGGWTTSGNVVPSSKSAYSGSFGAEMKGTAWIEKAVSTVGFTDIRITYARKTKGLDNGEFLYVEWSDGSTWHELEATQDTDWGLQDLPCVGADGNADFKLRFRNNASNPSECCYVDDVEINSTPSGPVDNPPSVDITNPSDGATVSSNVTVSADAIDDDGVTQVEFFVDGVSIGVDTDSSDGWSASWNTIAEGDGSHTVGATATDTALQIASDSISVTVDNVDDLPTVSITNPSDGATVSGNVTVNADATDDKGVTQVEFFVGGSSIGVDTDGSDGWSASWDTTAEGDGSHTVGATATDTASQIASDSISVTVDNAGPSTVSVQSIDMDLVSAGKNWKAVAKITISPVASGATVIGDWYLNGSSIQTDDTGVTDGSGYTELTSPPKKAQTGQAFTFVVTDVVLSGYVYDPPVPDEATKVVP